MPTGGITPRLKYIDISYHFKNLNVTKNWPILKEWIQEYCIERCVNLIVRSENESVISTHEIFSISKKFRFKEKVRYIDVQLSL